MSEITQEFLRHWYTKEAIREGHHQRRMYAEAWAAARMRHIHNLLEPLVPGARCLDLGCAEGWYSAWMADRGAREVVGVDLVQLKLDRADRRSNLRYVCASWDELPEGDLGPFDVALATEVLEHAVDPEALMAALRRMADVVVASVPIAEPEPTDPWRVQGHLRSYRPDAFKALFERLDRFETDAFCAYAVGR